MWILGGNKWCLFQATIECLPNKRSANKHSISIFGDFNADDEVNCCSQLYPSIHIKLNGGKALCFHLTLHSPSSFFPAAPVLKRRNFPIHPARRHRGRREERARNSISRKKKEGEEFHSPPLPELSPPPASIPIQNTFLLFSGCQDPFPTRPPSSSVERSFSHSQIGRGERGKGEKKKIRKRGERGGRLTLSIRRADGRLFSQIIFFGKRRDFLLLLCTKLCSSSLSKEVNWNLCARTHYIPFSTHVLSFNSSHARAKEAFSKKSFL